MTKPLRKKTGRTHDDDDAAGKRDSSSSSSSRGVIGGDSKGGEQGDITVPLSLFESEADQLAQELTDAGFDKAREFIAKHGAKRVSQGWESVKSKKPGLLRNPCGLLRFLVETPGKLPNPASPADKYVRGKYGHMVKR